MKYWFYLLVCFSLVFPVFAQDFCCPLKYKCLKPECPKSGSRCYPLECGGVCNEGYFLKAKWRPGEYLAVSKSQTKSLASPSPVSVSAP